MDCFEFGKTVAGLRQRVCIAHVLSGDLQTSENIRFASAVEANRGTITRESENVEDAIAWLNSI